jgi:hypothetical protein
MKAKDSQDVAYNIGSGHRNHLIEVFFRFVQAIECHTSEPVKRKDHSEQNKGEHDDGDFWQNIPIIVTAEEENELIPKEKTDYCDEHEQVGNRSGVRIKDPLEIFDFVFKACF